MSAPPRRTRPRHARTANRVRANRRTGRRTIQLRRPNHAGRTAASGREAPEAAAGSRYTRHLAHPHQLHHDALAQSLPCALAQADSPQTVRSNIARADEVCPFIPIENAAAGPVWGVSGAGIWPALVTAVPPVTLPNHMRNACLGVTFQRQKASSASRLLPSGQCGLSALRLLGVPLVERSAGTLLTFFTARTGGRSTGRTSNVRPTGASMLTSASRLNLLIFPFRRSETRGWSHEDARQLRSASNLLP